MSRASSSSSASSLLRFFTLVAFSFVFACILYLLAFLGASVHRLLHSLHYSLLRTFFEKYQKNSLDPLSRVSIAVHY